MLPMSDLLYAPSEPSVPAIDPEVVEEALAELTALRKGHGQLAMAKFSQCPTLVHICGEDDLVEAFLMFRRELERYAKGDKFQAAAALSISAPADTVLDRLTMAAEEFDYQDQRTIRRWSDTGMKRIAEDLVAIANVKGRLGKELLTLTLEGDAKTGLQLVIDQMDFTALPTLPPQVTIWLWRDEDTAEEASLDLRHEDGRSTSTERYKNVRHRVALPLDRLDPNQSGKLLTVAIQGRSAPSRTVVWTQEAILPRDLSVEVTVHRTMVMVEISRRAERCEIVPDSATLSH
jgi:hypothetical protein